MMNETNLILAENPEFETTHLLLRKVTLADVGALMTFKGDAETAQLAGFKKLENLKDAAADVANFYIPCALWNWGIVEKRSGRLIGDINLQIKGNTAAFGYALAREHWGQGYMTEAARVLRDFSFQKLGFDALIGDCLPENIGSAKVLEHIRLKKLGQIVSTDYGGKARLADYFALLKEDYDQITKDAD